MKTSIFLLVLVAGAVFADITPDSPDSNQNPPSEPAVNVKEAVNAATDDLEELKDDPKEPHTGQVLEEAEAEAEDNLAFSTEEAISDTGHTDNADELGGEEFWDYEDEDEDDEASEEKRIADKVAEEKVINELIDTYDEMEDIVEDVNVVDASEPEEADVSVEVEVEPVTTQVPIEVSSIDNEKQSTYQETSTTRTVTERRPNIVILLADDIGMGDIGCYGNDTIKTPFIDQLALDGAKMTHHLTAAAVCTPSRAALLTGRYPVRSGMAPSNIVRVNIFVASTGGLPAAEVTIAELAKEQGYATGFIGKWHMGMHCGEEDFCHHPNTQGFDHFYGLPMTNLKDFGPEGCTVTKSRVPNIDYYLIAAAVIGIATAIIFRKTLGTVIALLLLLLSILLPVATYLIYTNMHLMNGVLMRNLEIVEQPLDLENRLAARMVAESIAFIDEQVRNDVPFLLVVGWIQAHTALHTSPEFTGVSAHGRYGDNVEEMDWSVGMVLNALERHNLRDETLVYFTSDNGAHTEEVGPEGERWGGYNGIYRGGKAMGGMEGGIRVPGIVRYPSQIPAGSVIDQAISQMDFFTTTALLMGAQVPTDRKIDGTNVFPILQGETEAPPHEFLFHYCGVSLQAARYSPNDGTNNVYKVHYATPDWIPGTETCLFICGCYGNSVVWHDPPLLYNLATDPSEQTALDPTLAAYAEVLAKVAAAVETHKAGVEPVDDQMAPLKLLPYPSLQPCCGSGRFPNCHCAEPPFGG